MATPLNIEVNTTSNSFPKRRVACHFTSANYDFWVNRDDNDLQLKVRYEHSQGGLGTAEIDIYNLREEEIMAMTEYAYLSREHPFSVAIYAGYETIGSPKTKLQLIYEGTVLYSRPITARTDRLFKILAMENFAGLNASISYFSSEPQTFLQIAKAILEEIGFSVDMHAMDICKKYLPDEYAQHYGKLISSYSYSKKVREFLQDEVRLANKLQFIHDGSTIAFYPASSDWSLLLNQLSTSDGAFKKIDAAGSEGLTMVGIPQPNYYGVNLRILFNTAFRAGDNFILKSHFFPKADGRYQAIKCTYTLETRSQNFYIDIEGIRATGKTNPNSLNAANDRNAVDNISEQTPVKASQNVAEHANSYNEICIPAIVEEYDAKSNIATVRPAVKVKKRLNDGTEAFLRFPLCRVPVQRQGSGGFVFIVPIKKGTTGWLHGADRNTQAFLESDLSQPQDALDLRKYKWNFGHFVPDVIKGFAVSGDEAEGLSIQSMDGQTRIVLMPDGVVKVAAPTELKISSPLVSIDGDVHVGGDVIAGTISLRQHQHTYTQPSSNAGSLSGKPKE